MKQSVFSSELIAISRHLAESSMNNASFFPVDRASVQPFLNSILRLDPCQFIIYNLEHQSPIYATQLLLSTPEVLERLSGRDLEVIVSELSSSTSILTFVKFVNKYVQIDALYLLAKSGVIQGTYSSEICSYIRNNWEELVLSEDEREGLESEIEGRCLGYSAQQWMSIQGRLLSDGRMKPAHVDLKMLRINAENICNK